MTGALAWLSVSIASLATFRKCSLSFCCVPGTELRARDPAVSGMELLGLWTDYEMGRSFQEHNEVIEPTPGQQRLLRRRLQNIRHQKGRIFQEHEPTPEQRRSPSEEIRSQPGLLTPCTDVDVCASPLSQVDEEAWSRRTWVLPWPTLSWVDGGSEVDSLLQHLPSDSSAWVSHWVNRSALEDDTLDVTFIWVHI